MYAKRKMLVTAAGVTHAAYHARRRSVYDVDVFAAMHGTSRTVVAQGSNLCAVRPPVNGATFHAPPFSKQDFGSWPGDERHMKEALKRGIKRFVGRFGFELRPAASIPEASSDDWRFINAAKPYTMTSTECLWSTLIAVRHVVRNRIAGAFVECGVWRGGQAALAAHGFQSESDLRDIWLFDTFAGMTKPTDVDVNVFGKSSMKAYEAGRKGEINTWAYASLEEVRGTLGRTGYPADKLHFVKGPVEQTLRAQPLPDRIAILRLDTDWYESTLDELNILYPRLEAGGILMIDDYGHYAGARKAVDEYFRAQGTFPLLQPIDNSARIFVRP